MIIGYIENLSEHLKEVTKLRIYGLDDLVNNIKDDYKKPKPASFIEINNLLNQYAQKLGIILDTAGKGSALVLRIDGLLHGLNSIMIMGDKIMTFTYYSYAENKPVKQILSIKL